MGTSPQRCGTPSGFTRHQQAGERPCEACKAAKAAADKRWRETTPAGRRNRAHAKSQQLALRDLRHAHPEEYAALYAAHKAVVFECLALDDSRRDS